MNKEDKATIKYFDLLIKKIDDIFAFSINNIIHDTLKPESKKDKEIFFNVVDSVKSFGEKYKYFKRVSKATQNGGWHELTDKGIELKDSELGFTKFEKSLIPKQLDWYKIIPIIIAVVFGLLNVYQKYDYNQLKSDYNSLSIERDSLKEKLFDVNNNTAVNKVISLSDTLQTKN